MSRNALGHADSRPRVWLWIDAPRGDGGRYRWATHPAGHGEPALTAGAALEAALDAFGRGEVPMVIIWNGNGRPGLGEPENGG